MIITERERIELVKKLEEAMGEKAAATLMEYLPANGWRDVATVTDLDNLRLETKAEIAGVRGEIAELRGSIAELHGEMQAGFADLRREMSDRFEKQTRSLVLTFVGCLASFGGVVIAAIALLKP